MKLFSRSTSLLLTLLLSTTYLVGGSDTGREISPASSSQSGSDIVNADPSSQPTSPTIQDAFAKEFIDKVVSFNNTFNDLADGIDNITWKTRWSLILPSILTADASVREQILTVYQVAVLDIFDAKHHDNFKVVGKVDLSEMEMEIPTVIGKPMTDFIRKSFNTLANMMDTEFRKHPTNTEFWENKLKMLAYIETNAEPYLQFRRPVSLLKHIATVMMKLDFMSYMEAKQLFDLFS